MFKLSGIAFCCALIFLAGCATGPSQPPPEAVSPSAPPVSSSLNWTNPDAKYLLQPPPAPKPVARPAQTNRPPVVVPKPAPPVVTWTSLNEWAAAHHVGAPHRLADLPVAQYAVGSSRGVMLLVIGSREVSWNGIQLHLGFAPEMIDGEICLHGLDLQKNLEPLLCGSPLTLGASRVIVIDPGHGGGNTGAQSALDGRFEKEFTLAWALRLKPLLETNSWKVFLTRTSDVMVSNYDRVTFATAHHANLFISLHFNSTPDRNSLTGGLETYCITPTGMPSTLTRGFPDIWSEVLPVNAFDTQNLQLAVRVHAALLHATGLDDHGVRHSRFNTVLRGQNCPAILVEGGYLSNLEEAKLIESAEYQEKLAEAVAGALK